MVIDIIACLIIAYGFYSGYKKGLISTVFGVVSLIIGIVAALKISPIVINILKGFIPLQPSIVFIIGFILTFFLVMLLIRFIGNKIESIFNAAQLNSVNKLLGGALMGLVFAIMIGYLLYGMDRLSLIAPSTKTSSITYPLLSTLPAKSNEMAETLKPVFKGFWDTMMDTMDAIKEEGEHISTPASSQG